MVSRRRHMRFGNDGDRLVSPGASGSTPMPAKVAANAITMMFEFTEAMKLPSVVFDSATHRYLGASWSVALVTGSIRRNDFVCSACFTSAPTSADFDKSASTAVGRNKADRFLSRERDDIRLSIRSSVMTGRGTSARLETTPSSRHGILRGRPLAAVDPQVQARSGSRRGDLEDARSFMENVTSAPVLIIACLVALTSPTSDINSLFAGASIYAAVQNLMLAARAQDLGTVLTTFNIWIEDVLRAEFGLPDDAKPVAIIPVGYPDGQRFGPTTRKPVETVTFWESWGSTRQRMSLTSAAD
jgi:nitroreductase